MCAYLLFLTSQAWPALTPAPEEELKESVVFTVYNDQIQELKSIIRQRLEGTQVVTYSGPLYIVVCVFGHVCVHCHPL